MNIGNSFIETYEKIAAHAEIRSATGRRVDDTAVSSDAKSDPYTGGDSAPMGPGKGGGRDRDSGRLGNTANSLKAIVNKANLDKKLG